MKKVKAFVLIYVIALSLAGCNEPTSNEQVATSYPENTYIVMEVTWENILVAEIGEGGEAIETQQYSVPNWFPPHIDIEVGYRIEIDHNGKILETSPLLFEEIQSMTLYGDEAGPRFTVISD